MFLLVLFVAPLGDNKTREKYERWLCVFSGKIHWNFALIVWLLIQAKADIWLNPIPFMFGAMLPDADIKYSMIGKFIPLWLFLKHRGFTHSLVALVVFTAPFVYFMSWKWGYLFASGYMLHLMLDAGTPMGVKWFLGHKRKKKRAFR